MMEESYPGKSRKECLCLSLEESSIIFSTFNRVILYFSAFSVSFNLFFRLSVTRKSHFSSLKMSHTRFATFTASPTTVNSFRSSLPIPATTQLQNVCHCDASQWVVFYLLVLLPIASLQTMKMTILFLCLI